MERQTIINKRTGGWKAVLVIIAAGGTLLWHVLGCIESPMAFSPNGEKLAFVTMEPYGGDEENALALAGYRCYRLMLLSKTQELVVIEQTTSHMLSAPAFSPDGKKICYLRIPLLSEEGLDRLEKTIKQRREEFEKLTDRPEGKWPAPATTTAPTTSPSTAPVEAEEERLALPTWKSSVLFYQAIFTQPFAPVEVVVRDTESFEILSRVIIELPLFSVQHGGEFRTDYLIAYTTIRPAYGADDEWVYFCAGNMAVAVNPLSGKKVFLAGPATVGRLSPDAKTFAILQGAAIAFISTDGEISTYRRWEVEPELYGSWAWKDNQTIGLLCQAKENDKTVSVIRFVRIDGKNAGSIKLNLPASTLKEPAQLAFAPDGTHMVLSSTEETFLLDGEGQILKHWNAKTDSGSMVQPTFTHDSQFLAMKYMTGEPDSDEARVAAIVFFTVDGKEVTRVAIPRIDPATTRPASRPTTQSADN